MGPIDEKHQPKPFPPPPQQDWVRSMQSQLKTRGLDTCHKCTPRLCSHGLQNNKRLQHRHRVCPVCSSLIQ